MLPSFFCVGAQKAGTTTLHDILAQHPGLFLPEQKETKFFFRDELFEQGVGYYERHFFKNVEPGQLAGEIDPEYMYFDYVPKRIFETLGNGVKFIFLLRNPIDRAFSHYWMSVRKGHETLSFEAALEAETKRLRSGGRFEQLHFSYLDRGRYYSQIEQYLAFFPKTNMKIVIFEDFVKDIKSEIVSVLNFLKVDPGQKLNFNVRSNPRSVPRSVLWRDFVYKPNALKRIGKLFLPWKGARNYIISGIDKLNRKPVESLHCPEGLRKRLLQGSVLAEINKLELLLGKDLSLWKQ